MAGSRYHNIDKSPFHAGYTGYGVWKITRKDKGWRMVHLKSGQTHWRRTLREISDQLATLTVQASVRDAAKE